MVATGIRVRQATNKIRAFNPLRDAQAVTDLMALAFGDSLGVDGALALAEMQRMARWRFLIGLFYCFNWGWMDSAPGFVWVEDGKVVGNVSLRPGTEYDSFFIGNVAVHPAYRGRGIGRALMDAALDAVAMAGGDGWVGLEVREENVVARKLYEKLGFRSVGRTLHLLRQAGPWENEEPLRHPALRRVQSQDSAVLLQLVRATVPARHRALLSLRKSDYEVGWGRTLDCWLSGRREAWWVIEEDAMITGAVRALRERGRRANRLEVLVAPGWEGAFEDVLVRQGLSGIPRLCEKIVGIELPTSNPAMVAALEKRGFQPERVLVQMRYH
ncbi:MAG TPA: GNAT family N-acetyltransferase [Chloroflexi bacterium]|nr:GNAT family N-acetyltransferase [Chloroflexota bacterium]